jgi:hypothetical protein
MQVGLRLAKISYVADVFRETRAEDAIHILSNSSYFVGSNCQSQKVVELQYRNHRVGEGYPDLVVRLGREKNDRGTESGGDEMGAAEEQQLRNYMKLLRIKRGLLVNFQQPGKSLRRRGSKYGSCKGRSRSLAALTVLPYPCLDLASYRRLAAYQEWAFSSRPGNRARDKATVPASRIWRDAARRGQNPPCSLSPRCNSSGGFLDTWRKRMPNRTRIQKSLITTLDFRLENHGSLFLLRPLNSAAKDWMGEHLPMDNPETQFWGDAIVIEPR